MTTKMITGIVYKRGKKMYIVIHNLYRKLLGREDGSKAYFRKLGDCFDFVNKKEFASDLSKEECDKIKDHDNWYCQAYDASHMSIEQ